MRILIFWDSIIEWYYDFDKWWWANRLKVDFWSNNLDIEIWISWISWDEVIDVINRFDIVTKSFLNKYNDDVIFIFSIWINDSVTNIDNSKFICTEIDFKGNLQKLLIMSKKYFPKDIYFVWLNNVDESLVSPFPWSTTWKCYKNSRITVFNDIIKDISKTNDVNFVDIFNLLWKDDLYDWLHPNDKWHEKIFQYVKSKLVIK